MSAEIVENPKSNDSEINPTTSTTDCTIQLGQTSNELAESSVGNKSSNCDDLAKGISSVISSVITDFDLKAQQTIRSQDLLSSSIDRLTQELDRLLEDAPLPFIMQHAAKISGVRKRVSSLNSVLKSIQRRTDNIDRMVSIGLSHGKMISGNSEQQ